MYKNDKCFSKRIKGNHKTQKVKDYKSKSEDELIKILSKPKPKMEEIGKKFNELRDKFSKSKIKEIRKNLYEIENEKNLFTQKIKEIEKNILEFEKNLSKTDKKYYDSDDIEYKGIRSSLESRSSLTFRQR